MRKFLVNLSSPTGQQLIHSGLYVALLIGIAHVISGLVIMFVPDAIHVTPLSALPYAFRFTHRIGIGLILVGLFAIAGAVERNVSDLRRALCIAPQQVILLFQLYGITLALYQGMYPDGYVPKGGSWFILADQVWAWLLSVSHTLEFLILVIISRKVRT